MSMCSFVCIYIYIYTYIHIYIYVYMHMYMYVCLHTTLAAVHIALPESEFVDSFPFGIARARRSQTSVRDLLRWQARSDTMKSLRGTSFECHPPGTAPRSGFGHQAKLWRGRLQTLSLSSDSGVQTLNRAAGHGVGRLGFNATVLPNPRRFVGPELKNPTGEPKGDIYIYIYIYIYIHTHIYIYIYIHTYIHTYTPGLRYKIPVFSDPDPGKS